MWNLGSSYLNRYGYVNISGVGSMIIQPYKESGNKISEVIIKKTMKG